jgi:O-antigen/teichoic acid export membrane protein
LKRKFVTNLGFLIILNVLIKPLYVFGIDRVVQNTVGADAYGDYFSLFSLALIFQIFLDLGIENFIRKEVARNTSLVGHYLSDIALLKILLAIPYAAICVAIALPMDLDRHEIVMLLFILLNQFLASFILYFRANLGGLQLFKN